MTPEDLQKVKESIKETIDLSIIRDKEQQCDILSETDTN